MYVGMILCEESRARKRPLDTSASKAVPYCASCWWKQLRQRCAFMLTGDVGTFTWRCVDTGALPR